MKNYQAVGFIFCLVSLITCKGPKGDNGVLYPLPRFDFYGHVGVVKSGSFNFDNVTSLNELYTNAAGILVTVNGTRFSASTDGNGNFTIHGFPEGTYDLTFSSTGYGTQKLYGIQVLPSLDSIEGHNNLITKNGQPFRINQTSGLTINGLDFYNYSNENQTGIISFIFKLPPTVYLAKVFEKNLKNNHFIFYFGKDSAVSNTVGSYVISSFNQPYTAKVGGREFTSGNFNVGATLTNIDTVIVYTFNNNSFLKPYFNPGEKVFVAGYGINYYTYSTGDYYDFYLDKPVYSSMQGPSNIINFTMP